MTKPTESIYKRYQPALQPASRPDGNAYYLIFHSGRLLVSAEDGQSSIPVAGSLEHLLAAPLRTLYLGTFAGLPCYAAEAAPDSPAPEGMAFQPLRLLYDTLEEDLYHLAGRALQLLAWDDTHQFCGRCATPTVPSAAEWSRSCPQCGLIAYPRLAPAVITAILKDDRILLAHAPHFTDGMYGLIAGFVEPGETLEDCVQREAMEEIGIKVRNIRYFGSQQWPFPHSLMVGFLADYDSGEIKADGVEIDHADWFSFAELPVIPPKVSIARKMIDRLTAERTSVPDAP